ncbi:hypothetical protein HNP84_009662 [Thermocatellispora tengchongensis]|uniref:Right handed beta helix domain-containing protein n=1 Tax=Thermocatellispora tengchongensis TaxID=1073253 RepID=A0A840PK44_9ACTN|nr:hypothetical protein [Thermocatellispora tengchongensis]MBB5139898.1 hypothetical protein [Thermocatellispora tengchongensis]
MTHGPAGGRRRVLAALLLAGASAGCSFGGAEAEGRTPVPATTFATPLSPPTPTSAPVLPTPGSGGVEPPAALPGGWPGPHNTGVRPGVALRPSGSVKVTVPGTVVENLEIRGELVVAAHDVVVRNVRVVAQPGYWGIHQTKGHRGLVVEDTEVFGNGRQRTQFGILNDGGDITVRRVNIHAISNGVLTNEGVVEDSYFHDPIEYEGDHIDMIMATSGPPEGKTLVIRRNTVINTLVQTGAIALFQDFGVVRDVTVEKNFLAGGGYSLYGGAGDKGRTSNIKIIDNVFSRRVFPQGGKFGPVAYFEPGSPGNEWRGNVWEDGSPVQPS